MVGQVRSSVEGISERRHTLLGGDRAAATATGSLGVLGSPAGGSAGGSAGVAGGSASVAVGAS